MQQPLAVGADESLAVLPGPPPLPATIDKGGGENTSHHPEFTASVCTATAVLPLAQFEFGMPPTPTIEEKQQGAGLEQAEVSSTECVDWSASALPSAFLHASAEPLAKTTSHSIVKVRVRGVERVVNSSDPAVLQALALLNELSLLELG